MPRLRKARHKHLSHKALFITGLSLSNNPNLALSRAPFLIRQIVTTLLFFIHLTLWVSARTIWVFVLFWLFAPCHS